MPKTRIAVLFGGRSGEHEVSIRSAASVISAIDRHAYDVIPIAIDQQGRWLSPPESAALLPAETRDTTRTDTSIVVSQEPGRSRGIDVVFPVLHGTFGEDGTVQGLLELAGIAYVGAGVLASACGMDKHIMKRLFREAALPVVDHIMVLRHLADRSIEEIEARFRYPMFVKPANLGSSVGISKAHDQAELLSALALAGRYDRKIIVEPAIQGREIECSVLGNDHPVASVPGEILPSREFYDYQAKYLDDDSGLLIPAPLSEAQADNVRQLAVAAFQAIDCSGLARVDMFLERDSDQLLLNEINTMPGFTSISMYPKLWEASGVSYGQLIDELIRLAIERRNEARSLCYERTV